MSWVPPQIQRAVNAKVPARLCSHRFRSQAEAPALKAHRAFPPTRQGKPQAAKAPAQQTLLLRAIRWVFAAVGLPAPPLDQQTLCVLVRDFEMHHEGLRAGWEVEPETCARCAQHVCALLFELAGGKRVLVPISPGRCLPIAAERLKDFRDVERWFLEYAPLKDSVAAAIDLWSKDPASQSQVIRGLFRRVDRSSTGLIAWRDGEVLRLVRLCLAAYGLPALQCPSAILYQLIRDVGAGPQARLDETHAVMLIRHLMETLRSFLLSSSSSLAHAETVAGSVAETTNFVQTLLQRVLSFEPPLLSSAATEHLGCGLAAEGSPLRTAAPLGVQPRTAWTRNMTAMETSDAAGEPALAAEASSRGSTRGVAPGGRKCSRVLAAASLTPSTEVSPASNRQSNEGQKDQELQHVAEQPHDSGGDALLNTAIASSNVKGSRVVTMLGCDNAPQDSELMRALLRRRKLIEDELEALQEPKALSPLPAAESPSPCRRRLSGQAEYDESGFIETSFPLDAPGALEPADGLVGDEEPLDEELFRVVQATCARLAKRIKESSAGSAMGSSAAAALAARAARALLGEVEAACHLPDSTLAGLSVTSSAQEDDWLRPPVAHAQWFDVSTPIAPSGEPSGSGTPTNGRQPRLQRFSWSQANERGMTEDQQFHSEGTCTRALFNRGWLPANSALRGRSMLEEWVQELGSPDPCPSLRPPRNLAPISPRALDESEEEAIGLQP